MLNLTTTKRFERGANILQTVIEQIFGKVAIIIVKRKHYCSKDVHNWIYTEMIHYLDLTLI